MNGTKVFSKEELSVIKRLAFINWSKSTTNIGFAFNGTWVTTPFFEERSGKELKDMESMCNYYGKDNVYTIISKLINQAGLKMAC